MKEVTRIIYNGRIFSIEAFIDTSGKCPAEDFLESVPEKIRIKFITLFKRLGDEGKIYNEQKFKHLENSSQIFEFKADSGRVLCFFFVGKRVILTNGFFKKGQKTPKNEFERAENFKRIFESLFGGKHE